MTKQQDSGDSGDSVDRVLKHLNTAADSVVLFKNALGSITAAVVPMAVWYHLASLQDDTLSDGRTIQEALDGLAAKL